MKTGRNIYCDEKNINPLKIHYGDIVIFLATRELFRKQKKIDLSFTEFEILHLLMRNPGRVFSKEQIYDIIWNEPYSGDYNVVMRHICNIREKIEDDPAPINTRMVLEKGLRIFGSSRSGRSDYEGLLQLYEENPEVVSYLENIMGAEVEVRDVKDITRAFEMDIHKLMGKTVMIWNE